MPRGAILIPNAGLCKRRHTVKRYEMGVQLFASGTLPKVFCLPQVGIINWEPTPSMLPLITHERLEFFLVIISLLDVEMMN